MSSIKNGYGGWLVPAVAFLALTLFWLSVASRGDTQSSYQEKSAAVSISAPVLTLLYGGDRFLAANIEAVRAAASTTAPEAQSFRLRAHLEVSRLNPCHEDNYWIGNASLSWGGAEDEGFVLLRNTMRCRYWDEWPAFFYGFNQHFFNHKTEEARWALEQAAQRSTHAANAAVFRNFSIMLAAGEIDDTRTALELIEKERDQASDPKLKEMLDQRVTRLRGLLTLQDAQAAFETQTGRPLSEPRELLDTGLLDAYPTDPLGIGYEFRDNSFHLRQVRTR